jgi:hypothetical protein
MAHYSTPQAAKKLGMSLITLNRYIAAKKIPVPSVTTLGPVKVRLWGEEDIERVRVLLPKIANGRKTRYQKKHSAVSTQQSVKPKKKTQPRATVLHNPSKPKKKSKPPRSRSAG